MDANSLVLAVELFPGGLMSGLMGRILGIPKATTVAGFQVQTSVYGRPIPIVYGMTRIAGNLIHMPKLPAPFGSTGKVAGTKGAQSGQNYYAPLILAICEGPISGFGFVWRDKDGRLTFAGNYDVNGWGYKIGAATPTTWSYLTSDFPNQAIGYQFTAYTYNAGAVLPNDSLSQYSWEVQGFLPFSGFGLGQIPDASPAAIIPDLLQSAQYGLAIPSSRFASLTPFVDYCAAAGLFASIAIDTQKAASDWVNELLEVSNTGLVWSDGLIKFIPYGDVPLTGNGHTYTPNTTPLYDLTDSDFLPRGGDLDPVQVSRSDPATAFNMVTVEYLDRGDIAGDYNIATQTAQDQIAVETYGPIPMPTLVLHSITTARVAQQVAQMRLQREQNVRNTYTFRLGWRFSLLEPMDLVTITDSGLGLSLLPVRITSISDSGDESGFDLVAEDWPFGTASATLYATPNPVGLLPDANVDPGNTASPVIFEGPTPLQSAPLEIWVGASGGDNWGGCDVWISVDNATFEKVGTIHGKATFGLSTATLATNAAYPAIDTTHILAVNTTASGQQLVAQSNTNFTNLTPLCYLGGEFVAYRDLALTSALHYNLTHLYRGLYSSVIPASHASNSAFVFCDSAILRIPWAIGYIGQTVYFKFPAFNIYGAALQDVATVSSVSHVIGQDPIIPGSSTISPATSQGTVSVTVDGVASWQADLPGPWNSASPGTPASVKWSFSTSAYPSDATVSTTGTIITPSAGVHTVGATNFTTLSLGQPVYITILAYSSASGLGSILNTIHIQGAYLNLTANKTINFGAGQWQQIDPPLGSTIDNVTYDGNIAPNSPDLAIGSPLKLAMGYLLPAGVTITQVVMRGTFGSKVGGSVGAFTVRFFRSVGGGATTQLGSAAFTYAGGAQAGTLSLAETVGGSSGYLGRIDWTGAMDAGQSIGQDVAITYSMPDSKKTV